MIAPHQIVDAWLQDGRPSPMPLPTKTHLGECSACRAIVKEGDDLRACFAVPRNAMSSETGQALRFRLQGAARASANRHSRKPRGSAWRWIAAAALPLLL